MDWSDGSYEHTARALEPAARVALDVLAVKSGMKLLDVGSGTGNAAIEAARLGAHVTALDPAARLLEVARERAIAADLAIETKIGVAGAIPVDAATFDAAVSVFAVIFAPDAAAVAAELTRVVRPGGKMALTAWQSCGALFEAGRILRGAMATAFPDEPARSAPRWGDAGWVRSLFAPHRCYVEYTEHELVFEGESAEAWFSEQETHHPMWRGVKSALTASDPAAWERVRAETVAVLQEANGDAPTLRIRSPYVLYAIARP